MIGFKDFDVEDIYSYKTCNSLKITLNETIQGKTEIKNAYWNHSNEMNSDEIQKLFDQNIEK